ncbi:MAG TPA: hypothetical protein PK044_05595 [Exilispira sp.]|nr:hypothetical protein [Spirochaetota bacterium]NLJ05502.1 hypothetical protein [Exilispira sp.]HOV46484.1 hypothetical protein [Exilispira sp.]
MISVDRNQIDNFINLDFDEILEFFGEPDITDEMNYWFFDNDIRNILFIGYFDNTKNREFELVHKEDDLMTKNGPFNADTRTSMYLTNYLYQQGYPVLWLRASYDSKKENSRDFEMKSGLDIFIDDNLDIDLDDVKLIIFLYNEGRDYYTTTIKLPSKYKSIIKEFQLKERILDIPDLDYLSDTFHIPSINLACGFYNTGKADEKINYLDIEDAINAALGIADGFYKIEKETLPFKDSDDEEYQEEYDEEENEDLKKGYFDKESDYEDEEEDDDDYEDEDKDDDDYEEDEDDEEDYDDEDY